MGLSDEVKDYALTALEVDLVGVTSVDRLSGAPDGHRPTDLLPGSKSVIVMGVRLPVGALQAISRAHKDGLRHALCIYGTHGYALTPNYHLAFAAYRMARFLERKGFVTTPLPSGPGQGGYPFSHRHAAVAAGLGEFGWSSLVVTPEYGPKVRFVSAITRADLPPDRLYEGPMLCDSSTCGICTSVCPPKAISKTDSYSVDIGGRTFEYGVTDWAKCRTSIHGLTTKYMGLKDIPIPENPSDANEEEARRQMDEHQRREAILPVDRPTYFCGKCLAYCPIGSERERTLRRGLI